MLLEAMQKYLSFEHCVIAYMGIIPDLPSTDSIGRKLLSQKEVDILVDLTNRFLIRMTFRKRHKFLLYVLKGIEKHADLKNLGIEYFINKFLLQLPIQFMNVYKEK